MDKSTAEKLNNLYNKLSHCQTEVGRDMTRVQILAFVHGYITAILEGERIEITGSPDLKLNQIKKDLGLK